MPVANMHAKKMLKAAGRRFSSTDPEIRGAIMTAQTEKMQPLANASAASGIRAPITARNISVTAIPDDHSRKRRA